MIQFYSWKVWLRMLRTDVLVCSGYGLQLRSDGSGCEVIARAYAQGLPPRLEALRFHWEESRFLTLAGPIEQAVEPQQQRAA